MIRWKLDQICSERGITQYRLARDSGVRDETVNKMFNNQTADVRMRTLNLLCAYLKLQPGDIMEWIPDEPKESGTP